MHDPRVGRFFAVDPLFTKYPFYSPYQFSGNRVIDMVELEGLEPGIPAKPGEGTMTGYHQENGADGLPNGIDSPTRELDEVSVTNRTGAKIMNAVKDIAVSVLTPAAKISNAIVGGITGAGSISDELNASYNAAYAPSTDPYAAAAVCALPIVAVAAEAGAISYAVYEGGGFLWSQGARLWASQTAGLTWGKSLYGMASNGISQWAANAGDWKQINGIEVGMSAFGTYTSTVLGEGFGFKYQDYLDGYRLPSIPKSIDHAMLQIGGGVFSTYVGNKMEGFGSGVFGTAAGEIYKKMASFVFETGSNVAPILGDKIHPELKDVR